MKNIAIIGAGLSGLTVASKLKQHYHVTVFEKSRGVSGRMATRQAGAYMFDHGAQYFKAREQSFIQFIERQKSSGSILDWHTPVHQITNQTPVDIRELDAQDAKYISSPKMTTLCKSLAERLTIKLNIHIEQLIRQDKRWLLIDQAGSHHGPFDVVISSMPQPQFIALAGPYLEKDDNLDAVSMSGCFSMLIGDDKLEMPPFKAAKVTQSAIGWIALNSDKPGRNTQPSLVVQSTNAWADEFIDQKLDYVQSMLLEELNALLDIDYTNAKHISLHRWRYAFVTKPYEKDYYSNPALQLYACGDWCLGPRVESAFLSGLRLAEALSPD